MGILLPPLSLVKCNLMYFGQLAHSQEYRIILRIINEFVMNLAVLLQPMKGLGGNVGRATFMLDLLYFPWLHRFPIWAGWPGNKP